MGFLFLFFGFSYMYGKMFISFYILLETIFLDNIKICKGNGENFVKRSRIQIILED